MKTPSAISRHDASPPKARSRNSRSRVEGQIDTRTPAACCKGTDERFPPSLLSCASTDLHRRRATPCQNFAEGTCDKRRRPTRSSFLHALMMAINEHMTFDAEPTSTGTYGQRGLRSASAASARTTPISSSPAPASARRSRPALSPAISAAPTARPHQQAGHAWAEAYVPRSRLGRLRSGQCHLLCHAWCIWISAPRKRLKS